MKKQIATNCSSAFINATSVITKSMGISRNAYIETTAILECLKENRYYFTEEELDELWDDFPSKSNCKITKEFLDLHKKLPRDIKCEFINFFYQINLLQNVRYSTLKQANFYVRTANQVDEFLFYYGIINMRNYDIQYYIERLSISINTYGKEDGKSNEYMYLGKMQQFKNSAVVSQFFNKICEELKIKYCDCIKVHYLSLEGVLKVFKKL
ncbi:MAG: hypothetical protein ACREVX_01175 [Clostridium sp.]|uniref:hypothetical protein n=1 Tax=Clostridium sp. TaxID=1506 RepID=UPI003D6CA4D1